MDKSIFITGGSGFLGYNWIRYQSNKYNYYLINNKSITNVSKQRCIKIKNTESLGDFFHNKKIKLILHFAALTNLEECELDAKKCMNSNYNFTKKLVDLSKVSNIKIVFISTDQVYNGQNSFKSEIDNLYENNTYAKSKIYSENYILKNLDNFLILRTNFFGLSNNYKTFFEYIYHNLNEGNKINLWRNIYFNPVSVNSLIDIIIKLLNIGSNGIYNVCSDEKISKLDFGYLIAKKYNFNSSLINEIEYFDDDVFRPRDMTMSNFKIKKELNLNKIKIQDEINKLPNII